MKRCQYISQNKDTQPLLVLKWLEKLDIGLQGSKNSNIIRSVIRDERREKIIGEYDDLFNNNYTIKDLTIDIQLNNDTKSIQQKRRPVPINFQKIIRRELKKLIEKGHLQKADKMSKNCIASPL